MISIHLVKPYLPQSIKRFFFGLTLAATGLTGSLCWAQNSLEGVNEVLKSNTGVLAGVYQGGLPCQLRISADPYAPNIDLGSFTVEASAKDFGMTMLNTGDFERKRRYLVEKISRSRLNEWLGNGNRQTSRLSISFNKDLKIIGYEWKKSDSVTLFCDFGQNE